MPLFGKNSSDKKKLEESFKEKGVYPRQQPTVPLSKPFPPHPQYGNGHNTGPPPPYSAVPGTSQVNNVVVCPQAFDAGARFNYGAKPAIPPPPPGVMPNAAQVAASQGYNIVAGQRQQTFMEGTGDGGYVIW